MYKSKDDSFIWKEFLAGSKYAYEYIYKKYVQTLFTYGFTITSNEDLIKDCIQDVFVNIYINRKNLGSTNNIKLYLLASLKNLILMEFRKQNTYFKFKETVSKNDQISPNPVDKIINKEEEEEKKAVIDHIWTILTNRQKEIMYYRFVEGLSLTEIAEHQNMDYHSVANIISRSVKKIKQFYSKSD